MSADSTIADVLGGRAQWAVVCADNRTAMAALPPACIDHVISDPPFNQETSDGARSIKNLTERLVTFDGIDGQESAIVASWLGVVKRWCVAFCALEQIGEYKRAAGASWVRGTAWYRNNPSPQFTGDRPGQRYEGIAIFHPPGRKRWHRGGDCWAPVGNIAADIDRHGHPTPKPVWLMMDCLEAFTDAGDLILDPFCGAGTTGVAALRLGRRCILIEKDPTHAATARDRLDAESRGLSPRDVRAGQASLFEAAT